MFKSKWRRGRRGDAISTEMEVQLARKFRAYRNAKDKWSDRMSVIAAPLGAEVYLSCESHKMMLGAPRYYFHDIKGTKLPDATTRFPYSDFAFVAAKRIQRIFAKYLYLKYFCASLIQRYYRMYVIRRDYKKLLALSHFAARRIQHFYLIRIDRYRRRKAFYLKRMWIITKMQAMFRRKKALKMIPELVEQRRVRMMAKLIYWIRRGLRRHRRTRGIERRRRNHAIRIQRVVRGRQCRQGLFLLHSAQIKIAWRWRKYWKKKFRRYAKKFVGSLRRFVLRRKVWRIQSMIRGFLGRRRAEHYRLKLLSSSITICTNEQLCLNRAISNYAVEVLNWFGAQNSSQHADVARQMRQLDLLTRQILRRKVSSSRVSKDPPVIPSNPDDQFPPSLYKSVRSSVVARIRKVCNIPDPPSAEALATWPLAQQAKLTQNQLYVFAVLSAFANRPDGNIDYFALRACQPYLKPIKYSADVKSKMPGAFPYVAPDEDLVSKLLQSIPNKVKVPEQDSTMTRKPESYLYSMEAILSRAQAKKGPPPAEKEEIPQKKRRRKQKKETFFVPVVRGVFDDDTHGLHLPKLLQASFPIKFTSLDITKLRAFASGFQSQLPSIPLPEPIRAQLARLPPIQPVLNSALAKLPPIINIRSNIPSMPSLPPPLASIAQRVAALPSMAHLSPSVLGSLSRLASWIGKRKRVEEDESEFEDEEVDPDVTFDSQKRRNGTQVVQLCAAENDENSHVETGLTKGLEREERVKYKRSIQNEDETERMWSSLLKAHHHAVIELVLSNVFEPIAQQELVTSFFTGRLNPELLLHATLIRRWTKDIYSVCVSTVQTFRNRQEGYRPFRSCPRCLEPFFTEKSVIAHCGISRMRIRLEQKLKWTAGCAQQQCRSEGSMCWISRKTLSSATKIFDLVLKNRMKTHPALKLYNKTPALPFELGLAIGPSTNSANADNEPLIDQASQNASADPNETKSDAKKSKKTPTDRQPSPSPASKDGKKPKKKEDGDIPPKSPTPGSQEKKGKTRKSPAKDAPTGPDVEPPAAKLPSKDIRDENIAPPIVAIESSAVLEKSISFVSESLADYSVFPIAIPSETLASAAGATDTKSSSKKSSQTLAPTSPSLEKGSGKQKGKSPSKSKSPSRAKSPTGENSNSRPSSGEGSNKGKKQTSSKRPPSGETKKKKK